MKTTVPYQIVAPVLEALRAAHFLLKEYFKQKIFMFKTYVKTPQNVKDRLDNLTLQMQEMTSCRNRC